MSEYAKRTWTDGELITDEKMNNMEQGISEATKQAADNSANKATVASPVFNDSITLGTRAGITGKNSVAVGTDAEATELHAVAIGNGAGASGQHAVAIGTGAKATSVYAYARGGYVPVSGGNVYTEATAYGATAIGTGVKATADYANVEGYRTKSNGKYSKVIGKFNKELSSAAAQTSTGGDAFVIGNGISSNELSNAFRVTFGGAVYGLSAFNASGADYAEFFEWLDGNAEAEDRIGYFVTLEGDRIVKAKAGDYILGIVSGNPCIVGNSDEDWLGRWEKDEFGRFIKEEIDVPVTVWENITEPVVDEEGNTIGEMVIGAKEVETGETVKGWRYKENPEYDSNQTYIERKDRREWDYVGMIGVLAVRDDGTCQINGFCQVTDDGTATAAEGYVPGQTYRVMARVSENVVRVVFR